MVWITCTNTGVMDTILHGAGWHKGFVRCLGSRDAFIFLCCGRCKEPAMPPHPRSGTQIELKNLSHSAMTYQVISLPLRSSSVAFSAKNSTSLPVMGDINQNDAKRWRSSTLSPSPILPQTQQAPSYVRQTQLTSPLQQNERT